MVPGEQPLHQRLDDSSLFNLETAGVPRNPDSRQPLRHQHGKIPDSGVTAGPLLPVEADTYRGENSEPAETARKSLTSGPELENRIRIYRSFVLGTNTWRTALFRGCPTVKLGSTASRFAMTRWRTLRQSSLRVAGGAIPADYRVFPMSAIRIEQTLRPHQPDVRS